jgi:hypothetical protein
MKLILLAIFLIQLNQHVNGFNLQSMFNRDKTSTGLKFNYQNCGPPNDPMIVEALSVSPDPVHFPGVLNITAAVSLAKNITSPLTV